MRGKPLEFKMLDNGCIVPLHHKLNQDGYEIHHTCHNRSCCNINHLELIEGHAHAILSDMERYAKRQMQAKKCWLATHCTGVRLGEIFGVSFSAACQWIRGWKV